MTPKRRLRRKPRVLGPLGLRHRARCLGKLGLAAAGFVAGSPKTMPAGASSSSDQPVYKTTRWRWFVLFYFSLTSMNQCLAWFSFSSLSQATMQAYFGTAMDTPTIDLLLNWGPIIGVAFFPVQTWLLQQKRGLQRGIWLALHLMLGGTVIRAVPIIVTQSSGWVPVPLTVNGTVANLPPGEEPPFAQT